jgi:O-antigen ligase
LTISRGSVLALVASSFVVLVMKERLAKTMVALTAAAISSVLAFTYPLWVDTGRPNGFVEAGAVEGLASRDANVLDRALYLWPRAVDLFVHSPIFGTGFGSFDDTPYHLEGTPGLFSYNVPDAPNFTAAHAHNSYLHILAETGVVGLGLFLWMLVEIRRSIKSFQSRTVRLGLTLAFWVAIYASFTEHRLVTPSQMLTFMLVFGLSLASHRFSQSHATSKAIGAPVFGNVAIK